MKAPLKILMVEDSEDDTLLMLGELKRGGYEPEFERVDSEDEMDAALVRQSWDVVVSDNSMPGFGSLDALALLKQRQPGVPFIVVSGSMGDDLVANMMRAGASDFVVKNQLSRLAPSIERRLFETAKRRLLHDEGPSSNISLVVPPETAREDFQVTKDFLAAIVNSCEDAIIGLSLEGVILSWNAGAEALYRFTAAEVRGRAMSDLLPSHNESELRELYDRIRRGSHIARYESARLRRDGMTFEVSLSLSPVKDPAGNVIGISLVERDVTVEKREEAVRLNLIRELTEALGNAITLKGLLPICSACSKIRDNHGAWRKVESFISEHTGAGFTHGVCPDCMGRLYPDYVKKKEGC